jgi:hypothetical protein
MCCAPLTRPHSRATYLACVRCSPRPCVRSSTETRGNEQAHRGAPSAKSLFAATSERGSAQWSHHASGPRNLTGGSLRRVLCIAISYVRCVVQVSDPTPANQPSASDVTAENSQPRRRNPPASPARSRRFGRRDRWSYPRWRAAESSRRRKAQGKRQRPTVGRARAGPLSRRCAI